MESQLKIVWDGDVSGISQHRLSIAEFGEPLKLLLVAARRIANQMVMSAVEGEKAETGRLANTARGLDIEIAGIDEGSTGLSTIVTFRPPAQFKMFENLSERVAIEFLESVERESKGEPSNGAVRNYLRSLPRGLTRQVYEVWNGTGPKKKTEISSLNLAQMPQDLPILRRIEGSVVGVGFEPGKTEVRVKGEKDAAIPLAAMPDAVEYALELRREKVRVIAVQHDGKRTRLVSLKRASDPRFKFSAESAREHIFSRWNNVLKQLAK